MGIRGASVVKYRGIIALMDDFYSDLIRNNKKDTKLRHAELQRLLKETGVLPVTRGAATGGMGGR
jgi:hypothetical protein